MALTDGWFLDYAMIRRKLIRSKIWIPLVLSLSPSDYICHCSWHLEDLTKCPHKADYCKYLLAGQHKCFMYGNLIGEHRLWVCSGFSSRAQQVLLVLLRWIVWWDANGHTISFFQGATLKICVKQLAASLNNSHLAFLKRLV